LQGEGKTVHVKVQAPKRLNLAKTPDFRHL
jgi:hypothetical protein